MISYKFNPLGTYKEPKDWVYLFNFNGELSVKSISLNYGAGSTVNDSVRSIKINRSDLEYAKTLDPLNRDLYIQNNSTILEFTQSGGEVWTSVDFTLPISYRTPMSVITASWSAVNQPNRVSSTTLTQSESGLQIEVHVNQASHTETYTYVFSVIPTIYDSIPSSGTTYTPTVTSTRTTYIDGVSQGALSHPFIRTIPSGYSSWITSYSAYGFNVLQNSTYGIRSGSVTYTQQDSSIVRIVTVGQKGAAGAVMFNAAGTYNWTVPAGVTSVDVFLVGAGGQGSSALIGTGGGGGGGYTMTRKSNNLAPYGWTKDGDAISIAQGTAIITIGSGKSGYGNPSQIEFPQGSSTSILAAVGGRKSADDGAYGNGGNGGSGGGAYVGRDGGSDGNNGTNYSSSYTGGTGQGHTTRPFAEDGSWAVGLGLPQAVDVPYAAGGGGGDRDDGGMGGTFGGGKGSVSGVDPINGFGGGGGGNVNSSAGGKNGACGCVIIRWGFD